MTTVLVQQNVPARMRDGVTLCADVYRPADDGRYPVLLCRTPYGKAGVGSPFSPLGFAQAGYVAVVQDTRGRGTSEGSFVYMASLPHESSDGYDSVEWAAALPYSDGNVGMFGASYFGWTQWAAAMQRPPHLRAIAPVQTWSDFVAPTGSRGGAYELGVTLSWHLAMSIEATMRKLGAAGAPPSDVLGAAGQVMAACDRLSRGGYREVPLRDLGSLREVGLGDLLAYQLDLRPGTLPEGWSVRASEVEVPSLNVAGWYDLLLQGTLDNYVGARSRGRGPARQSRLLVGPWTHGNYASTVGELDLGMAASGDTVDLTALQLRWFDHWLKGINNGIDREPPVRAFLTGENRWLDLPDWPPAEVHGQPLYLQPKGALGFAAPSIGDSATGYAYDPADPAPTLGGNTLMPGVYPPGVKDQRPLSQRPDVLTFVGASLEQPFTVMGRVTANLFVSSSAPDSDFVVRLVDVHPDGYLENVCDGILRVRYRESLSEPSWLEAGKVYKLEIDLWSTAHVFGAGHEIAVQVTSSSFPRWDRNWNTKEDLSAAISGQVAQQTIWHDAGHPSCVVLPVIG